ncbi:MAG: hypothetical protein RLZZ28_2227 [Bacteroidota bacterium]|jgi:hypothetical protein
MRFLKLLSAIFCLLLTESVFAQVSEQSALFIQLKTADSILFEEGFNKCNFTALKKKVHKDLEFLHDQGGIQDAQAFYTAVEKNICANPDKKPIRKLTAGTLQVYPMKSQGVLYGAIQMGIHEFYIAEPGKALYLTSTARFIHTWILENEEWKLKHVLSYDHKPAPGSN